MFDFCFSPEVNKWLRGATVARLTPDQKAACSNHVGVNTFYLIFSTTNSDSVTTDGIKTGVATTGQHNNSPKGRPLSPAFPRP